MEEILISDFKARCIALLKKVHRTKKPFVVTLRGEPLVKVEPYIIAQKKRMLGSLRGQLDIHGDIVRIDWSSDWEDVAP